MEDILNLAHKAVTLVLRNTKENTELKDAYDSIKEAEDNVPYLEEDSDNTRTQGEHDEKVKELIKAYCKLANEALDSTAPEPGVQPEAKKRCIDTPKEQCKFFKQGKCRAGATCRFAHPMTKCTFYSAGKCNAGDYCKFLHV